MYDNNGNNEIYYTQYQGGGPTEPQPPKKPKNRKTHRTAKVVALVAAVTVLCGGAGFGGAFFANKASDFILGAANSSANENTGNAGNAGNTPNHGSSGSSSIAMPPEGASEALDALQSSTVSRPVSGDVEYNSDGSYAYTRDLVADVKDAVVYIEVYVSYRGQETLYGAGSGVIFSSDGYIITNAHVAENEVYPVSRLSVSVNTTDPETGDSISSKYDAALVGSDVDTDLAVLKIEAKNLRTARLGDSDKLSLGDDVVVIGNPLGLETSVSKGIVSGLNRQVYDDNSISAIQTDTAINSGNSGGGLFNMYGEVVGIVNMKLVDDYVENLGFAISINDAKTVISDLITNGYVTGRPILGITCLQVSDYLGAIQNMTPGLLVTSIDETLAIAQSELIVGDTITAVNDVQVRTVDDVSAVIKDMSPGDAVTVTVVRIDSRGREKSYDFDVVLSEYNGS